MTTRGYFDCVLADQPHYLVPPHLLPKKADDWARWDLDVNPHCWFSWQGKPPPAISRNLPLPAKFRYDFDMLWVHDGLRGCVVPFWVGPRFRDSIAHLAPGARANGLSARKRSLLALAGVLAARGQDGASNGRWESQRSRAAREFRGRGYACMEHLIHPFHLGALRRYYRHLLRTGQMILGDSGSPLRYVSHNECVAVFFHRQLASMVAQIVGVPVKPSYTYVSCYQSGADLPVHTDREQCEYSISLLVDHSPESSGPSPWPLWLNTNAGTVAIRQRLGDALFYRGREIAHYRTRLPEGRTSTSIFFHYVDRHFAGSLD